MVRAVLELRLEDTKSWANVKPNGLKRMLGMEDIHFVSNRNRLMYVKIK